MSPRVAAQCVRLGGKDTTHLKHLCPSSASLNRFSFLYISCCFVSFLLFKLLMASDWTQSQKYIFKENKRVFIINKYYSVYKFDGECFPQPGQREPQMRNDLHLIGLWTCLGTFSWLLIDVGVALPQQTEPFLGRWTWAAGGTRVGQQQSKQPSSTV